MVLSFACSVFSVDAKLVRGPCKKVHRYIWGGKDLFFNLLNFVQILNFVPPAVRLSLTPQL